MRMRLGIVGVFIAVLATAAVMAAQASQAEMMLEAARKLEVVDGNYSAAIKQYQAIVDRFTRTEPHTAATALLRMADCYQKTGSVQARATLERVVKEFGTQTAQVAEARTRLAMLGGRPARGERQVCVGPDCLFDLGSISRDGRWAVSGAGSLRLHDMITGATSILVASLKDAPGDVENAFISPDGQTVAYTWCCENTPPGRSSLRLIRNERGAQPRVLVDDEAVAYPYPVGWSPDGSRILAVLSNQDWSSKLAWVSAANGAVRVITNRPPESPLRDASVSPDGRFIVFSTGPNRQNQQATRQMYAIDADGARPPRSLSSGSNADNNPVWTADGRYVLHTSDRAGTTDVWALPIRDGAAAGPSIRVKADVGSMWPLGATSDGMFYYFRRRERLQRLLVAELDTTGRLPTTPRIVETFIGSSPSWSPDGKLLAFERPDKSLDTAQIVVHSFETSAARTYSVKLAALAAVGPEPHRASSPALWLGDSGGLLQQFDANRNFPKDVQPTGFWFRIHLSRGVVEPMVQMDRIRIPGEGNSIGWRHPFALARDGNTAYLLRPEPGQAARIVSIDVQTGAERVLFALPAGVRAGPGAALALSRDERTLALGWSKDGGTTFAMVGMDGTGYRELGHYPSPGIVQTQLAWTHDGGALLFTRRPADGNCRLMRITASGGQTEFTGLERESPSLCRFAASPVDSRVVLVVSEAASELWAIDVSEAALRNRTR